VLAGYDINAQYLSAAAIELGTGDPEHLEWPADTAWRNHPGYVHVAALECAPWGIGRDWPEAGRWMATPLVKYLADEGAEMLISEAWVWPRHRRWLDPHVNLMRSARGQLAGHPELLRVVKNLYTRMFGGLLGSEKHNHGRTYRPDWRDMIVAEAQARMFRGLDKTPARDRSHGVALVGVFADAAWFVMPDGFEHPPGLVVSDQLGKWKQGRTRTGQIARTAWSEDLANAHADGKQKTLWEALHSGR